MLKIGKAFGAALLPVIPCATPASWRNHNRVKIICRNHETPAEAELGIALKKQCSACHSIIVPSHPFGVGGLHSALEFHGQHPRFHFVVRGPELK
jgi:hypothetical protein